MNSGYIFISRKAIIVTWVVFYRVNYPTTNVPLPQVQEDFREQARIMMYFQIGREVTLLFKGWNVKDTNELASYIVIIFALAVLYECLRGLQKAFMFKSRMPTRRPIRSKEEKSAALRKRLVQHILATLLHIVQISLGYLLMLLVMTYNYMIFICTIAGITLGYYLAEPLIVRSIENVYMARVQRGFVEELPDVSNGHGVHLLQEVVNENG